MGKGLMLLELSHGVQTDPDLVGLTRDDIESVVDLAVQWDKPKEMGIHVAEGNAKDGVALSKLDWSPKENWVDKAGGLPKYIEDIALALIRDHGMSRSRAIATAISRIKRWAAGGEDVKADTQAKATAALAQWEKMKASTKAKRVSK